MKKIVGLSTFILLYLVSFSFVSALDQPKEIRTKNGDYEYARKFNRDYQVDPKSGFTLFTEFGDVIVTGSDQKSVQVVAEIKTSASKEKYAQEFGADIKIEVSESAAELRVETKYPNSTTYRDGLFSKKSVSYSVNYTIRLPATMAVKVRNSFGKVTITGVQGNLNAQTNHQSLSVIDCANVGQLENQFGLIRVQNIGGKNIEIETSNNDIEAKVVKTTVTFNNRFGKVEVTGVTGDLIINNSNGDVSAADVKGTVAIDNQFAAIEVKTISGSIKINSRNGSVRIKDVPGGYVRNSFGAVRITNSSDARTGINVENQNGDIYLETIAGDATLATSFARIDALDVQGKVMIQAGNSTIEIRNPGGTVDVNNSFGSVNIKGSQNDCNIRNGNGSIDLTVLKIGANYRLSTTFAPIKITLPEELSATFDVETSFGDIECEFPLKIWKSASRMALEGKISTGAAQIRIENQNGSVYIRKVTGGK